MTLTLLSLLTLTVLVQAVSTIKLWRRLVDLEEEVRYPHRRTGIRP